MENATEILLNIRDMNPSDFDVWAKMVDGYSGGTLTDQLEESWRRLVGPMDTMYGKIAEIDGVAVGFMHFTHHFFCFGVNPRVCYLADLYVEPEHRRKGVARAMLEWLIESERARYTGRVYWVTEETNEVARRLYDQYADKGFIRYNVDLVDGM